MSEVNWITWDPARGQDYVLEDKKNGLIFSSVNQNFYAAECVGEIVWGDIIEIIAKLFNKSSRSGFFLHYPWGKNVVKKIFESNPHLVGQVQLTKNRICGLIQPQCFDALMSIWRDAGGHDSGEWYFIGFDALPRDIENTFERKGLVYMLKNFDSLKFVLEFAEMRQSMLLVKSISSIDEDLRELQS